MEEMFVQPIEAPKEIALPEPAEAMMQMTNAMRGMAELIRTTNARIAALEKEVRRLTKVTPAQAAALNAAMRTRAAILCAKHGLTGCETQVTAAIRRAIRVTCGIQATKDLPRCEYQIAAAQIQMWDDYGEIRKIREKRNG